MILVQRPRRKASRQRQRRRRGLRLETLDPRWLLSASGLGLHLASPDALPSLIADPGIDLPSATQQPLADLSVGGAAATASAATYSLASVLALNSLPGAAHTLYLDFDGDFEAQWGAYSNVTIPAYDQDGDPTTFSDGELASIQQIWRYVAEDYAPFNVNVTTAAPSSLSDGVAQKVAIGGDGSWTGGIYGGLSYLGAFTNSTPNVSFVFPKNLGNGNPHYTGDASSHEAGHSFGLEHQSLYDANGNLVKEYYSGAGDGRAPLMGSSYSATRGLWWYGTSTSATTYQDDMAILAGGLGYRPDHHGNTAAGATSLTVSGNQLGGSGVIATTSDVDYFSFTTDAGLVAISVTVPASVNDLDSRLELHAGDGSLIASDAPISGFGAMISANLAAGTYYVAVAGNGSYGDVGQYAISGTIVPPASSINAPTNLTAIVDPSGQVSLAWTDQAANETGYRVERSTDGQTWTPLATNLPADSTSFTDGSVSAGTTCQYRVDAFDSTVTSPYSNQATVTLAPATPAGLTATAVSSSRIDLAWQDVYGETGFEIERTIDGVNWSVLALTAANTTSYQDLGLAAMTQYEYRICAVNAGGESADTPIVAGTTLASSTVPNAPSNLVASATSSRRIALIWQDNSSNETGFLIERSTNSGGSWTKIAQVGANVTSFTDRGLKSRKTYWYRLRAVNSFGKSAYSNVAGTTTPAAAVKRKPVAAEASPISVQSVPSAKAAGAPVSMEAARLAAAGLSWRQTSSLANAQTSVATDAAFEDFESLRTLRTLPPLRSIGGR